MDYIQLALMLFLGSAVIGLMVFWIILWLLPTLEVKENQAQKQEVLKEALRQGEVIRSGAISRDSEHLAVLNEELEAFIQERVEDLTIEEDDCTAREELAGAEERRVQQLLESRERREAELAQELEALKDKAAVIDQLREEIVVRAIKIVGVDPAVMRETISRNLVQDRQLEAQKILKSLQEEMQASSRKLAWRALDRVAARYAPHFIWPKPPNIVEVPDAVVAELGVNDGALLDSLREASGVTIKLVVGESDRSSPHVKVVGGFGIAREAARLAVEDVVRKGKPDWNRSVSFFKTHYGRLEAEAATLGRRAIEDLELRDIHPEIQKLIGSLNWRTSYRQNQWYHTVEVAVLAGILAHELGVDPQAAKRVGLLHDIGKALDYRIEGSHAVISGDYADRFGESRLICDTVMSHHSDLLVETPLAYVLRAADTLSGARPGARVNLEEGYQIRLSAIYDVIQSFEGISDVAVMNGGREVHIQVNHDRVARDQMEGLAERMAKKLEEDVAYPGQIKIILSRIYESSVVAG